jgi:hypothetical protein
MFHQPKNFPAKRFCIFRNMAEVIADKRKLRLLRFHIFYSAHPIKRFCAFDTARQGIHGVSWYYYHAIVFQHINNFCDVFQVNVFRKDF